MLRNFSSLRPFQCKSGEPGQTPKRTECSSLSICAPVSSTGASVHARVVRSQPTFEFANAESARGADKTCACGHVGEGEKTLNNICGTP